MEFFKLEPEVPGEILEGTRLDLRKHPPVVTELDVVFLGWLGDALLTIFPCFLVTDPLKNALEAASVTGCSFEEFSYCFGEHTTSEMRATKFWWMQLSPFDGFLDVSVDGTGDLIASARTIEVLEPFQLLFCERTTHLENLGDTSNTRDTPSR